MGFVTSSHAPVWGQRWQSWHRSRWPGEDKIPATTAAPVRRDRAPQGAREGEPLVKSTLSHFYQGHLQPLVKSRAMKQYSLVGAEDTEGAQGPRSVAPAREVVPGQKEVGGEAEDRSG